MMDKSLLYAPPIGMVKIIPIPKPPPTHVPHLPVDVHVLSDYEQKRLAESKAQVVAYKERKEREADFNTRLYEDYKKAQVQEAILGEVDGMIAKARKTWLKTHSLEDQDGSWGVQGLTSIPQPYTGGYEPQHTKRFRRK